MKKKALGSLMALCLLSLTSCGKGWERQQAINNAENNGADWVVSQYDMNGHTARCWLLTNVSVANEEHSDGLHWQDNDGHLIHISGWYNRVMVLHGDFQEAGNQIDIPDVRQCHKG